MSTKETSTQIFNAKDILFVFIAFAFSIKVFLVSFDEPYSEITFNEIIWQYIMPTTILTFSISLIYSKLDKGLSLKQFVVFLSILIIPILLNIEAIYGYSYELYHHFNVR